MKRSLTFCNTLNPQLYLQRSELQSRSLRFRFRNVYSLLFLFRERDQQRSRHASATAIVYSCILPRSCIPVSRFALIRFRPLLGMRARACASTRTDCGAAASSIFRRQLYRGSSTVHVIHPCCELAVVRIRVLVPRPRSLPSCSRTKL